MLYTLPLQMTTTSLICILKAVICYSPHSLTLNENLLIQVPLVRRGQLLEAGPADAFHSQPIVGQACPQIEKAA